jgi:hypothetical protein
MPRRSNQEIERHYFELFRRIYPLPNGQVKYGNKPDVIVEGERTIGIEITGFYLVRGELPESEQIQRKIREDVLKKAQLRYSGQGGNLEISFSFNMEQPIMNGNMLITKIVDLIRRIEASGLRREIPKRHFENIPEISFIYINPNLYNDPKWRALQVYNGQIMSIPRLKEILREKEEKAKKYSKCDAYWLLAVVDFINPAMDQEIQIEGVELKSDVYEKIIVYKTTSEHVLELKG